MTKQTKWEDKLFDLSEKYCKHDSRKYNSCLYHIFLPFIDSLLQAEREEIKEKLLANGHGGGNWRRIIEQLL